MLLADDGKEEYTTPRPKKSMKLTEEGPEVSKLCIGSSDVLYATDPGFVIRSHQEQGSADANHDSGSTSTGESCADAEMSDSQRKKIEERKKAAKAKQEAKKRGYPSSLLFLSPLRCIQITEHSQLNHWQA